jgi:hypothetical protein
VIPSRSLKHSSEFEFREASVLHSLEDVGAQLQFPFPPVGPCPPRQLSPLSLSALPNTWISCKARVHILLLPGFDSFIQLLSGALIVEQVSDISERRWGHHGRRKVSYAVSSPATNVGLANRKPATDECQQVE